VNKAHLIIGGIVIFISLILVSCSMTTVATGHRGAKVTFGEVVGDALPEGLYFVNPFTTHVEEIDVRQFRWDGKTEAFTKDVQQANITFTLNYGLDPLAAHLVYRDVGPDWISRLVGQDVVEEIKREIGQNEAVLLISNREAAARKMERNIVSMLGKRHVVVSSFRLTDIDYQPEFRKAVEDKVVAVQNAIAEQNRTVQIQEKAKQQIETAKGNAESTVLNAKAEAESIAIRARALEQNAKLVEWEAVQKWNGTLPQYVMGNSIPFVNLTPQK
jgi:regulator of protease activity HflC (stomatin/prohibitin superfamily)